MEEEILIENTADGGGQIAVTPYKKGYAVKRYRGVAEQVDVPAWIKEKPVIAVERKAFLSCKTIKKITLPDTVEEIGDWAFAHAEQLRTIIIPHRYLIRGKELFLGCKRLREIVLRARDNCSEGEEHNKHDKIGGEGLGRMLALAVTVLHDYFLFDPMEVGADDWIRRWDEKLIALIELDDLDGFEELWTCGEEDYEGKDYDIKSYPVEKRKMKLRLVYFRLLHPYKLAENTECRLQEYLRSHTKGTQTPEAWELIVEEHPQELAYYQLLAASGGIMEENFDSLLEDLREGSAEIKAYLLRYKEEHFAAKDVFAAFELDW